MNNRNEFERHLAEAKKGCPLSQYLVGNAYFYAEMEELDREAFDWYERAVKQGYVKAIYRLGDCFFCGSIGVEEDGDRAEELWTRAMPGLIAEAEEDGDAEAQYLLGDAYRYGCGGIGMDLTKTFYWQSRAAEQGHALAQCQVGDYCKHGRGTKEDPVQAFQWYQKAAEQGFKRGQFALAKCYRDGYGVEKDLIQAMHWFQENGNSREDFKRLMEAIAEDRKHLMSRVQNMLAADDDDDDADDTDDNNISNSNSKAALWGTVMTTLASHKPAGFSPLFVVVKETLINHVVMKEALVNHGLRQCGR